MSIINNAIEKIDTEIKNFKSNENKAKAISKYVADALKSFCSQDEEFAQAVVQNSKTLTDCCNEVVKGCGNYLSDIETYKKAAQFYFSTADIHFNMTIDLCGNNGAYEKKPSLNISLDSLLDF